MEPDSLISTYYGLSKLRRCIGKELWFLLLLGACDGVKAVVYNDLQIFDMEVLHIANLRLVHLNTSNGLIKGVTIGISHDDHLGRHLLVRLLGNMKPVSQYL